jgi:hypothetical protein
LTETSEEAACAGIVEDIAALARKLDTTQAALGKTSRHSAKARLVVTMVLFCS